jgi:hypothetical protein
MLSLQNFNVFFGMMSGGKSSYVGNTVLRFRSNRSRSTSERSIAFTAKKPGHWFERLQRCLAVKSKKTSHALSTTTLYSFEEWALILGNKPGNQNFNTVGLRKWQLILVWHDSSFWLWTAIYMGI